MVFHITFQCVQSKTGRIHYLRSFGHVEQSQDDLQTPGMGCLNASFLSCTEESLKTLVLKGFNHAGVA